METKKMTIEQKRELGNAIFDILCDSGIQVSDMIDTLLNVVAVINTSSKDPNLSALVLCKILLEKTGTVNELEKQQNLN